jgi:[acyl-carrier-protein] S-malonyltransferase
VAVKEPRVPVVANATGRPHGTAAEIRRTMVAQVTSPVQWVSCVEWLRGDGCGQYVEFGPGKVVTGLIKRIDSDAALHSIQDSDTLARTVEALRGGAARSV